MEELKRVQELRVDEFSRGRLIENQDTISELTARIQKLQNEVNCMNDLIDFKDAESVRSGPSHVPSQPALFPLYRDPRGLLSRSDLPPNILVRESQTPAQDQRCQSGPSARNSVIPCEGDFSKNYGADQQRLQISELHFDKFPTPSTFACWKIRLKTEVCTCSQFPT